MTLGAVCVVVEGSIPHGWGTSNSDGRTLTVVGATTLGPFVPNAVQTGGPIAAGADGNVYFNFSATTSNVDYTSMYDY
jgi:hypothetical protein